MQTGVPDIDKILEQVHNAKIGHWGIRKTWLLLNKHFPGHRIPYKMIEEYVLTCKTCQKDRLGILDNINASVSEASTHK
jgi:hypothetical protein